MKARHILPHLLAALRDTPVVFLQGPRQSGKTTLVQGLRHNEHNAEYYTFDDAAVHAAAHTDPSGFVENLPDRVILDEVQRVPDIFMAIKRSVDKRRTPGRFLLTGSAQALVLPQASEALVGRMEVLTLWPFSQGEIAGRDESFVDQCFARTFSQHHRVESIWPSLIDRIVKGGFPEAVSRSDAGRRSEWFGSYVTTILQRDVRDLANISAIRELPRLLQLAASRASTLLNFSSLSRDAAIPQTTLKRYWSLLEATFLTKTVDPWSANLGTRLVKAPKIIFPDTGLLCHLAGLSKESLRGDDAMAGPVLETFVGGELLKQISWSKTHPSLFHFRTHAQQEVDYVLEDAAGRVVGIEVKKSSSPSSHDFNGLRSLKELSGKKFIRGMVLYTGSSTVAFGPDLFAVPLGALWH